MRRRVLVIRSLPGSGTSSGYCVMLWRIDEDEMMVDQKKQKGKHNNRPLPRTARRAFPGMPNLRPGRSGMRPGGGGGARETFAIGHQARAGGKKMPFQLS